MVPEQENNIFGFKYTLNKRTEKQKSNFGGNCQKQANRNHAKTRNHRRHGRLVSFESCPRGMTDRLFGNFFI